MDVDYNSYPYDLECDLYNMLEIQTNIKDDLFAAALYVSMCNMQWQHKENSELGLHTLLTTDRDDHWSCTWRYSGTIVADLRNKFYHKHEVETYLDWYPMNGNPKGQKLIYEILAKYKWYPMPWTDDGL